MVHLNQCVSTQFVVQQVGLLFVLLKSCVFVENHFSYHRVTGLNFILSYSLIPSCTCTKPHWSAAPRNCSWNRSWYPPPVTTVSISGPRGCWARIFCGSAEKQFLTFWGSHPNHQTGLCWCMFKHQQPGNPTRMSCWNLTFSSLLMRMSFAGFYNPQQGLFFSLICCTDSPVTLLMGPHEPFAWIHYYHCFVRGFVRVFPTEHVCPYGRCGSAQVSGKHAKKCLKPSPRKNRDWFWHIVLSSDQWSLKSIGQISAFDGFGLKFLRPLIFRHACVVGLRNPHSYHRKIPIESLLYQLVGLNVGETCGCMVLVKGQLHPSI